MNLLWYEQVTNHDSQAAASYYSYGTTERHFRLGLGMLVDVEVEFYPSRAKVSRAGLKSVTTVEFQEPIE